MEAASKRIRFNPHIEERTFSKNKEEKDGLEEESTDDEEGATEHKGKIPSNTNTKESSNIIVEDISFSFDNINHSVFPNKKDGATQDGDDVASNTSIDSPKSHTKLTLQRKRSNIRKHLCPHRPHGCVFEANDSDEIKTHLEKDCALEKIKEYIRNKEDEMNEIRKQLASERREHAKQMQMVGQQLQLMDTHIQELTNRTLSLESFVSKTNSNNNNLISYPFKTPARITNNEHQSSNNPANWNFFPTAISNKPFQQNNDHNNEHNNHNNHQILALTSVPSTVVTTTSSRTVNTTLKATLEGHKQIVACIANTDKYIFSGSGDSLLVGSLKIWDINTFELVHSIEDCGVVYSLAVFEDKLVSGHLHLIKIWDMSTFQVVNVLEGHNGEVKVLKTFKNYLFSGAVDTLIKVWDLNEFKLVDTISGHTNQVVCLEVVIRENNFYLFSGSHDHHIKIWNGDLKLVNTLYGHNGEVRGMALAGDVLITGSEDGTIRFWDWKQGKEEHVIDKVLPVSALQVGRMGGNATIFTGHNNGIIMIWDFTTKQCLQVLAAHKERVRVLHGAKKMLMSGSYDKTIKLWEC